MQQGLQADSNVSVLEAQSACASLHDSSCFHEKARQSYFIPVTNIFFKVFSVLLHGEFSVFVLVRTIGLAIPYADHYFIIWKCFPVVWS